MALPNLPSDLKRQLSEDPRDEGVVMNVTSGLMWLVAGAGGLAALALPGAPREHLVWLLALAALSFAWGTAVLTLRFPRPGTPLERRALVTAVLIAIVGVALWASGGADSYLQPILLFTAIHIAYYYPPRLAWPLAVLFVATYATPLLYDPDAVATGYAPRLLLFAIAVGGTCAIVRRLKRRLLAAEERQRAMAELDPLTGLANRRAFDAALARAVGRRDAHGRATALLLLDFDDFKAINDTFGHPVGDAVLRAIAGACRPEVRGVDCFARIGGDEFAVIARGAGAIGADRLASVLADAIADADLPDALDHVAVTIAWATVPEDASSAEGLIQIADRRLLDRKRERKQPTPA
jgi:diguanylate cyclase (GGDEF)-like protein